MPSRLSLVPAVVLIAFGYFHTCIAKDCDGPLSPDWQAYANEHGSLAVGESALDLFSSGGAGYVAIGHVIDADQWKMMRSDVMVKWSADGHSGFESFVRVFDGALEFDDTFDTGSLWLPDAHALLFSQSTRGSFGPTESVFAYTGINWAKLTESNTAVTLVVMLRSIDAQAQPSDSMTLALRQIVLDDWQTWSLSQADGVAAVSSNGTIGKTLSAGHAIITDPCRPVMLPTCSGALSPMWTVMSQSVGLDVDGAVKLVAIGNYASLLVSYALPMSAWVETGADLVIGWSAYQCPGSWRGATVYTQVLSGAYNILSDASRNALPVLGEDAPGVLAMIETHVPFPFTESVISYDTLNWTRMQRFDDHVTVTFRMSTSQSSGCVFGVVLRYVILGNVQSWQFANNPRNRLLPSGITPTNYRKYFLVTDRCVPRQIESTTTVATTNPTSTTDATTTTQDATTTPGRVSTTSLESANVPLTEAITSSLPDSSSASASPGIVTVALVGVSMCVLCAIIVVCAVRRYRRGRRRRLPPATLPKVSLHARVSGATTQSYRESRRSGKVSPRKSLGRLSSSSGGLAGSSRHRRSRRSVALSPLATVNMPKTRDIVELRSALTESRAIIPSSELQLGELLGEGAFGAVYRGTWRNVDVAIKVVKAGHAKAEKDLISEAMQMTRLRPHVNVVQVFGICTEPLSLVLQFCSAGPLDRALYSGTEAERITFSDTQTLALCQGIAAGIGHLHAEGIVHRDIAARNVLLHRESDQYVPKITDFGMSRGGGADGRASVLQQTYDAVGPLKWMAPEQMVDGFYSAASDVWAFGVVLYEVFARSAPWPGKTGAVAAATVLRGGHIDIPSGAPDVVRDVMGKCFAQEHTQRPSMQEAWQAFTDAIAESKAGYAAPPRSHEPLTASSLSLPEYVDPPQSPDTAHVPVNTGGIDSYTIPPKPTHRE